MWWWVLGVVAALALLSAYLTWTARRVDRLHVRVGAAARALDAQLMRRAAAAAVVAERHDVPELYAAARAALDAEPGEREAAENDLTRQIGALVLRLGDPAAQTVATISRRVALARQVHTDLVRDALLARGRPVVRLFRMARHHPRPRYFDIVEPATQVIAPAPAVPAERTPAAALDRR